MSFLNKITLNDKKVIYQELKVKQYKNILKCLLDESPSPDILFLNLNKILLESTNLTTKELDELDVVDYIRLFCILRKDSIGNIVYATITNRENTRLEIDLNGSINLIELFNKKQIEDVFEFEDWKIYFGIPKIKDFYISSRNFFISKVFYKDVELNISLEEVLKLIPVKIFVKITQISEKIKTKFKKFYFYKSDNGKYDINLNLDIKDVVFIFRLLFNDNLLNFYETIFSLSKYANITPEYLENCTPGEYSIFAKQLEKQFNVSSATSSKQFNEEQFVNDIDPNKVFGDFGNNVASE
jgi:hypothetical protein